VRAVVVAKRQRLFFRSVVRVFTSFFHRHLFPKIIIALYMRGNNKTNLKKHCHQKRDFHEKLHPHLSSFLFFRAARNNEWLIVLSLSLSLSLSFLLFLSSVFCFVTDNSFFFFSF